jgi:hypothetical protein
MACCYLLGAPARHGLMWVQMWANGTVLAGVGVVQSFSWGCLPTLRIAALAHHSCTARTVDCMLHECLGECAALTPSIGCHGRKLSAFQPPGCVHCPPCRVAGRAGLYFACVLWLLLRVVASTTIPCPWLVALTAIAKAAI